MGDKEREKERQAMLAAWRGRAENRLILRGQWQEMAAGSANSDAVNFLILAAEIINDRGGKLPENYGVHGWREVESYLGSELGIDIVKRHYQAPWLTIHLHWQPDATLSEITIDVSPGGDFTNYAKYKSRYGLVAETYRISLTRPGSKNQSVSFTDARTLERFDNGKTRVGAQYLAEVATQIRRIESGEDRANYTKGSRPWVPASGHGPLR